MNSGAAVTLSCPAVGGKPSCGHWDFESNTAEGWAIDTSVLGGPGASSGPPIASTVTAFSGSRSLAIPFLGTGNNNMLFVKVRLCAAGQPGISLTGKTIRVAARLITSAGSPALNNGQGHYVGVFQGATLLTGVNGDFSVNPANGGGFDGSTWVRLDTGPQIVPLTGITDIGFRFLTNGPWTGTVYIDDLQIID
jgi:hypothetical protein